MFLSGVNFVWTWSLTARQGWAIIFTRRLDEIIYILSVRRKNRLVGGKKDFKIVSYHIAYSCWSTIAVAKGELCLYGTAATKGVIIQPPDDIWVHIEQLWSDIDKTCCSATYRTANQGFRGEKTAINRLRYKYGEFGCLTVTR